MTRSDGQCHLETDTDTLGSSHVAELLHPVLTRCAHPKGSPELSRGQSWCPEHVFTEKFNQLWSASGGEVQSPRARFSRRTVAFGSRSYRGGVSCTGGYSRI